MLRAAPDLRILGFNAAVALVTGVLFGLAPALSATRLDLWGSLKDVVGSIAGSGSSVTLRKCLVTAQVAFSFLLLAGAGLFVKTLANLKNTQTGFGSTRSRPRPTGTSRGCPGSVWGWRLAFRPRIGPAATWRRNCLA
jgi:hypothetical protein